MSSKRAPIKSAALLAAILLALFLFLPASVAHAEGVPANVDSTNWMSGLNDDIPISDLSIPGTHDSGTMWAKYNWSGLSKCQDTTIGPYTYKDGDDTKYCDGLLARGVRHLDLRIERYNPGDEYCLVLCHGFRSNWCYLEDSDIDDEDNPLTIEIVVDWVETFLREHPTETVILEFTNEIGGDEDKPYVYDYFNDLAHKPGSLVWKGDHVPTLGEVRGKMVLFSNKVYPQESYAEEGGGHWAFAVEWAAGNTDDKCAASAGSWPYFELWTQNKCDGIYPASEKWEYVRNTIFRVNGASASQAEKVTAENAAKGRRTWFVSYASANNGFWGVLGPTDFAEVVNPNLRSQLANEGSDAFCGLLAMDFVTEDLARHVWATNYNRWGPTTYEWSEDNSTCTARRIKIGERGVDETVTVKTGVDPYTRPATCTRDGVRTYRALFRNTSWASDQIKDVVAPALGHEWGIEKDVHEGQRYTYAHVWCNREGCDYDKDKGFYMQLSAPDAQYDGEPHEAKYSCRMPQDMQNLLIHEYFDGSGHEKEKRDGAPVCAGTYTAKLTLDGAQQVSIERKYEITPRPVNVVALDQIVTTDKPAIETGVEYAMLLPVEGSQLVDGDVLESVELSQKGASGNNDTDGTSGIITPGSARISRDGVGDVTDSYVIEDENYVDGTWLKVDQGMPIFTPPMAKLGMTYDRTEMELVNPGRIDEQYNYEMQYVLTSDHKTPGDNAVWSPNVPTARDAGIYSVWYCLVNKSDANDKIGPLRTFATISPCFVDLAWDLGSDKFVYDGEPHIPGAQVEGFFEGDDLTVSVTAHQTFVVQGENLAAVVDEGPSKVGYYVAEAKLGGTAADNYRIKNKVRGATCIFYIVPRLVSIQGAVAKGKVYDSTCDVELDLSNVSFDGLVGTDDLTLVDCTAAFADPNAGEDKEVPVENVFLGGKDVIEYVLDDNPLTLAATIDPREARLHWGTTEFWYDGLAHVPVPDVGGLLGADRCTAIMGGEAIEVGTHTATAVGLDNPNYCLPNDVSHSFEIRLADIDTPYKVVLKNNSPELTSANLGTVANEQTTIEERGRCANGIPLMVTLTSKGVEESAVPESDASSVQELLSAQGLTAGQWLDLSLTKELDTDTTTISKTKTPVQIEVTVPEKLRAAGRTFSLIRCHDGKAEKIAEGSDTTFKTETDAFSNYLIAYHDASTPQPGPEEKQGSAGESKQGSTQQTATQQAANQQAARSNLASTGDTANTMGFVGALAVAALALAASGLALRRK